MPLTKKEFEIIKQKGSATPYPVSIAMERQKSIPELRIIEELNK